MIQGVIRVLVVDDSAYMRKAIREMLEKSPFIEVVDTARNGREALDKTAEHRPDVVTIDLVMPDFDGVQFIREQMNRLPLPIVVCSSASMGGDLEIAAMEAGAVEFVQKPTALALDKIYNIQNAIVQAVQNAAAVPVDKLALPDSLPPLNPFEQTPVFKRDAHQIEAVLIGLSTGGPRALRALLPRFPRNFPAAIAIVLHMPPEYTLPLAQKLNELSPIEVLESTEGLEMKPGRAILAKAGYHTRLYQAADGRVKTTLSQEPINSIYCPSVDELFRSGADVYGDQVLALVMTGMGNDGTAGAGWIKAQGGVIFAESEESSTIFGMPRSVIEAGLADRIVTLEHIPQAVMEAVL